MKEKFLKVHIDVKNRVADIGVKNAIDDILLLIGEADDGKEGTSLY